MLEIAPGETITARILVSAPRAIKCKQLTAKLRFFAHGSGNAHQKVVEEKALYAGEFSPGQHEYTVQFVLPYGPYSYAGHYMNLDWEVQAYLDIPWALDKKGATQFSLVSEGASAPQEHLEQLEPRPNIGMHAEGFVVAGIGLMLCLLSIGIILGAGLEGAGCAIINGIIQLPKPPIMAGMTMKKTMIRPWAVMNTFHMCSEVSKSDVPPMNSAHHCRYWMPGSASSRRMMPEIAPPTIPAIIAKIR